MVKCLMHSKGNMWKINALYYTIVRVETTTRNFNIHTEFTLKQSNSSLLMGLASLLPTDFMIVCKLHTVMF